MGKTTIDRHRHYINLVRGLAIFLMLWGHCIQCCIPQGADFYNNSTFKFIYSFHMPLFMLISGYLFFYSSEKRDMKTLLSGRCKSLLQTIVFCSIFIYVMTSGVYEMLTGNWDALVGGPWINSLKSLWFIWSVLSASLVVGFVCKKVEKTWLQIVLLVVGFLVVLLFPCGIENAFLYPYFVIGFYFAKYKARLPRPVLLLKYLSLVGFPILLLFFEKKHYIYTSGLYGNGNSLVQSLAIDGFRWLIGLVGSVCVLVVMDILYSLIIRHKPNLFLWKGIAYLGQKSLQIYALSIAFLSGWLPIVYAIVVKRLPAIDSFFLKNGIAFDFGLTLGLGIAYAIGLSLLVKLFEKIKFNRVLFGR